MHQDRSKTLILAAALLGAVACGPAADGPAEAPRETPQDRTPHDAGEAQEAGVAPTPDAAVADAGREIPPDAGHATPPDAGQPPAPDAGPASPEAMCLERAADTCQACGCRACLAELDACDAEPGCAEIRACAEAAECAGISCVGPCGDLIREHGGPFGDAIEVLTDLGDCMNAACPGCLPE